MLDAVPIAVTTSPNTWQVSEFFSPLDAGHSRGELRLEDAQSEVELN